MSSISINIGDVFLIDTPPNGQHFYVAIAKTSGNKYLFVNLTDSKEFVFSHQIRVYQVFLKRNLL
jgi:hypothetical protein